MDTSPPKWKKNGGRSKGSPPLFSAFGKKARDSIAMYSSKEHKFSVSSSIRESGLTMMSTACRYDKPSAGKMSALYKYKYVTAHVAVDAESNLSANYTCQNQISESAEAVTSFRWPDYHSSKLNVRYFHDHATLAMSSSMSKSAKLDISASIGTSTAAFGIGATYNTSCKFSTYSAGIDVTKGNSNVSVIWDNKDNLLSIKYLNYLGQSKKISAVIDFSRSFSRKDTTLIVGGKWVFDNLMKVKATLNNHGKIKTLLQHEYRPKSLMSLSIEFNAIALDKVPKMGLALALNL